MGTWLLSEENLRHKGLCISIWRLEMIQKEKTVHIAYLYPIRLITRKNEKIDIPLEQINNCSYNHGILCRVVGEVKNSFKNDELTYLICGDGALALSYDGNMSNNDLLLHYNDLLCKLLLGGLMVESISQKDITTGSLRDDNMIWPVNFGHSHNSHIHAVLRMKLTNSFEAIHLLNAVSSATSVEELVRCLDAGTKIIKAIDRLSTYYLIAGITEMRYGNWSSALSNLWIVAEQLTDYLWVNRFLNDASRDPEIPSRRQTLLNDNRTYSASVKQEILFQIGILSEVAYTDLYIVRKARNKLVHEGQLISEETARKLYSAVNDLLKIAISNESSDVLPEVESLIITLK